MPLLEVINGVFCQMWPDPKPAEVNEMPYTDLGWLSYHSI